MVKTSWSYVYRDLFSKPTMGIRRFYGKTGRWSGKTMGVVDGNTAKKIISFINKKAKRYPHKDEYHYYPCPNSNTFTQWIIDEFPESGLKLPWNAFGKRYVNKEKHKNL